MQCYTALENDVVPGFQVQTDRVRPYVRVGNVVVPLSDELIVASGGAARIFQAGILRLGKSFRLVPDKTNPSDALVLFGLNTFGNLRFPATTDPIFQTETRDYWGNRLVGRYTWIVTHLPAGGGIGYNEEVEMPKPKRAPFGRWERWFGVAAEFEKKTVNVPLFAYLGGRMIKV